MAAYAGVPSNHLTHGNFLPTFLSIIIKNTPLISMILTRVSLGIWENNKSSLISRISTCCTSIIVVTNYFDL